MHDFCMGLTGTSSRSWVAVPQLRWQGWRDPRAVSQRRGCRPRETDRAARAGREDHDCCRRDNAARAARCLQYLPPGASGAAAGAVRYGLPSVVFTSGRITPPLCPAPSCPIHISPRASVGGIPVLSLVARCHDYPLLWSALLRAGATFSLLDCVSITPPLPPPLSPRFRGASRPWRKRRPPRRRCGRCWTPPPPQRCAPRGRRGRPLGPARPPRRPPGGVVAGVPAGRRRRRGRPRHGAAGRGRRRAGGGGQAGERPRDGGARPGGPRAGRP